MSLLRLTPPAPGGGHMSCSDAIVKVHESFEDDDIADVMNEHFFNIKVDREERCCCLILIKFTNFVHAHCTSNHHTQ